MRSRVRMVSVVEFEISGKYLQFLKSCDTFLLGTTFHQDTVYYVLTLVLKSVNEDEDALRRSCFLCRRSSILEQSPSCYSSCDSVDSFKVQLKTYLFTKAYP